MFAERSELSILDHYLHAGAVTIKSITFSGVSQAGAVTVGSITYTNGTDFTVQNNDIYLTARSLADCVNGLYESDNPSTKGIHPTVYARNVGSKVYLFARVPGINFALSSTIAGASIAAVYDSTTGGAAIAYNAVNAADLIETFTYLDAGLSDERIGTIVTSSASLGITYTDTFVYLGSPGAYRISTITRT